MLTLENFLKAAQVLQSLAVALPEVRKTLEAAAGALKIEDQDEAKAALADLIAENDERHQRLQAKLAAAANR